MLERIFASAADQAGQLTVVAVTRAIAATRARAERDRMEHDVQ
jgi:hypothetical protein